MGEIMRATYATTNNNSNNNAPKSAQTARTTRGRQLFNQLTAAAGSDAPTDPLALLKLIDDPTVTEGFNKKSAEMFASDRSTDGLDRTPMPKQSNRFTQTTKARWADPSLLFALRQNQLAVPIRA
jgi:hypothetical protein